MAPAAPLVSLIVSAEQLAGDHPIIPAALIFSSTFVFQLKKLTILLPPTFLRKVSTVFD
jgi:hypothetical protein